MNQIHSRSRSTSLQLLPRSFYHAQIIDPGSTLICEKGILWLTQSNDINDYMLKPGDQLVMNKKTNILVEALSESRMSILHSN